MESQHAMVECANGGVPRLWGPGDADRHVEDHPAWAGREEQDPVSHGERLAEGG